MIIRKIGAALAATVAAAALAAGVATTGHIYGDGTHAVTASTRSQGYVMEINNPGAQLQSALVYGGSRNSIYGD